MNAIRNLWNAFARLAAALNGMAETVEQANARAKDQLGYEPEVVIDHVPALPNGKGKTLVRR